MAVMRALHSATRPFAASAALLLAVVSVAWPRVSAPTRTAVQLELRAIDGGSRYYQGFSSSLPVTPSFFPIGIWFQGVASSAEVEQDRGVGINLYVVLTDNSDLGVVGAAGAAAAVEPGQFPNDESSSRPGSETRAWFLGDEIDMLHGAGWHPCGMPDSGYSCMQEARDGADDGRLGIANYGKGVTFWENDRDAATFVNRFQDVVSADNYWFTDPNICRSSEGGRLLAGGRRDLPQGECRRASNYGATVERIRSLVERPGSKPVWAFVELGHPFTEDSAPKIKPSEMTAAVWSSIIHGARGIIYFAHSFGGRCESHDVLNERCGTAMRAAVAETNRRVTSLAPVLNSPFVENYVEASGSIDTMVKWFDGHFYVFAGSRATTNRPQRSSVSLACGHAERSTVLFENRSVPVTSGRFRDTFATSNSVHIYRIVGDPSCAPAQE
jgi:hypothetical protein